MTPRILSPELQQQFEALRVLLQRSLWLAERCADADATQILRARLANLQSAALLVIVGEVKAGKSSFINALVGEEVCGVAPGPCTDRIQELVYGAQRNVVNLGQAWERISLPKEVLREITLVDTPGTNSIVQNQQTITENYMPQSDMVVFVIAATNPHTNSAWEFLTLIRKEWHRKMVFVLQQADRASAKELATNRAHVVQYARERGVHNPAIFTLSAKRETEANGESGFAEFRNFLRYGIERGEVWRTKFEGSYQTIQTVMTKLLEHLRTEKAAFTEERAFYQQLLRTVETRAARASSLKQLVLDKLALAYERLARNSEDEFAESLDAGKMVRWAIASWRKNDEQTWEQDVSERFQKSAQREVETETRRVSKELFTEMQMMMEELAESIGRRREGTRENLHLPHASESLELLQQLTAKLESVRVGDDLLRRRVADAPDRGKFPLTGKALGAFAATVGAVALLLWFNRVAGIAAGLVIVALLVALNWRRTNILRDVRQQLGDSRQEFHDLLESEISEIFDGLFNEVRQALAETVFRLDLRASHLTPVLDEAFRVGEAASEMVLRSRRMPVPQTAAG